MTSIPAGGAAKYFTERAEFLWTALAGVNVKVMALVSFSPIVTTWVAVPNASCHASIGVGPGGSDFSSNLPSSLVTAKYGWSRTLTNGAIQPVRATLHGHPDLLLRERVDCRHARIDWPMLNSLFSLGSARMLCSVASPLWISRGCPAWMPKNVRDEPAILLVEGDRLRRRGEDGCRVRP